jgi:hypothetical protein
MLEHSAYAGPTALTLASQADLLRLAVAQALAAPPAPARATATGDDAVQGGFERMLAHRSVPAAQPQAPQGVPADPLLATMVVPLRDGAATIVAANEAARLR